jgi:tetratricopeptide (TPR) repeat protein
MKKRRQRIGLLSTSLGGLASLLLAFPASHPAPASPPPEVEYSGCRTVSFPGPLCSPWPDKAQLKLWVRVDPGAEVELRADGKRLPIAGEESRGGRRFKLQLPSRASFLTVQLRRREGHLSWTWSLILVPPRAPKWEDEIKTLAGKAAELRLVKLRSTVPQNEWAYLFRPLALQAHVKGHDDEAAFWLKQGIQMNRGEGLLSEEVDKATILARFYIEDRRFAEARQVLKDLSIPAGAPADSRYLVAYFQGLLADHVGDYGSALDSLQQASDIAERGGMDKLRLESGQVLARVYEELGRSKESEELFIQLHAVQPTGCELGTFRTNEAWSRLLAREGGEKADDPTPMLKQAQTLFEDAPCALPRQKLNARLNLALAALQANQWLEARQALSEAEPLVSHATLEQRLWWLDLKGRQAIAEGDLRGSLQLYRELAGMAKETSSIEGGFRAAVGRANAQLKLDQPAAAVVSFKEADRLIDEQTLHIPASAGRDTFVGQRELAVRQYLKLLLRRGQRQEAFELVRRDRSRLLRQLEVRDRLANMTSGQQELWDRAMSKYWTLHAQMDQEAAQEDRLPGDELKRAMESQAMRLDQARKELDRAMAELGDPEHRRESRPSPPSPGEVILAYHPLPEGWAGFAATSEGIQVSCFYLPDDVLANPGAAQFRAALAPKLIGPFQSVLERAARVRVLPFGPLRAVDFHALPLAGEPLLLLDRLPVVYGLDVATRPSPAPAGRQVALLVADPEDNLPEARKESRSVAETIRGQGWAPKLLEGKDAGAGAVRGVLTGASLFEFAGHGELAGFAGWESSLRLAAGSRLTSRDVLTLRVPAWVVLSTCEGGLSSKEAPGEGIGLAQAFLLAGSRAVVAAVRPVRDSTARRFVDELHRYWKPGTDLVQPFRLAQRACLQRYADCASFRLFEP